MNLNHDNFDKCPVTGLPIPGGTSWTDHDKPGPFNSCAACSEDVGSIADSLKKLNDERAPLSGEDDD